MRQIATVADGVTKIDSGVPGKVIAIVGGVHGDEMTGIMVVSALIECFKQGKLKLVSGVLYLVHANLEAIARGQRGSVPGADMNRCFAEEVLVGLVGSGYEEQRARELATVLCDVEIGIDVHATSKPSSPFIFCQRLPQVEDEQCFRWFNAGHIVADPNMMFAGQRVALDEYFSRQGGVGLCYETGFAGDTSRVTEVMGEMISMLCDLGACEPSQAVVPPGHLQMKFELTGAIVHPGFGYKWRAGFGEHTFQDFPANIMSAFDCDDNVSEAPRFEDHVVIFPKPETRWVLGKPVGYMARRLP
ncbi:MAG: succinylglutamate desuccinylase/aspartoacylase family protein [bacterium]|nr:succinylglutamate desuccinylase/aspartoacylase family protein [bacterium]